MPLNLISDPWIPVLDTLGRRRIIAPWQMTDPSLLRPDWPRADLMVRRGRYAVLDLPLAAMALYAFQAHAPSGGAGNRTSMRGGGPLVTLVDPGAGLWSLIWANMPGGVAQGAAVLPWMRPTKVSDTGAQVFPPPGHGLGAEAFFGMPRRLRLVVQGDVVTGVVQRPWGINYAGWEHPLTPYYRQKPGTELLPVHPRAGRFGYRHWLGILAEAPDTDLRQRARVLRLRHGRDGAASVIVAGWAMDNMKSRDFTQSVQPLVVLDRVAEGMLAGFQDCLQALQAGVASAEVAAQWLVVLRRVALDRFEARALPGLDQLETDVIARIVAAQRFLVGCFKGYGKYGSAMFGKLDMAAPAKVKKVVA